MRVLYFDCFCGVSGDMLLASLLDLGADEQQVRAALDATNLAGYELKVEKVVKGGLTAMSVIVDVADQDSPERGLPDSPAGRVLDRRPRGGGPQGPPGGGPPRRVAGDLGRGVWCGREFVRRRPRARAHRH